MPDFLPTRDADLLTFAQHFAAYVVAHAVQLGFTSALGTQLNDVVVDFNDAYQISSNPLTATKGARVEKALRRAVLKATLRQFARQIQANPAVTAQQKTDLGLRVRDQEPTSQGAPNTQPVGRVVGTVNLDVVTEWFDQLTPTRRARPAGYAGLAIYSFVGDEPPADIELWRHEGLSTKSRYTVGFNAADAGKKITIVARWYSRKGEFGPLSAPMTTMIAPLSMAA